MDAGNEVLTNILGIAISWPAAICFVIGIALIIIEMFTPGLTAPGIVGFILIIIAIILTADGFAQGLLLLLGVIAILSIALFFVLRSASKGVLSRSPIIKKETEEEYLSVDDMKFFVGKEGEALTILRPAGTADFNGVRLDVVTEGSFIKQGTKVKVIRVEGRRIIVAPLALENNKN
jgi:membrane-bound ClpP family serine protease